MLAGVCVSYSWLQLQRREAQAQLPAPGARGTSALAGSALCGRPQEYGLADRLQMPPVRGALVSLGWTPQR